MLGFQVSERFGIKIGYLRMKTKLIIELTNLDDRDGYQADVFMEMPALGRVKSGHFEAKTNAELFKLILSELFGE